MHAADFAAIANVKSSTGENVVDAEMMDVSVSRRALWGILDDKDENEDEKMEATAERKFLCSAQNV